MPRLVRPGQKIRLHPFARKSNLLRWQEGASGGQGVTTLILGECMELDPQRVHDETYRWEVVAGLMREHADAIAHYCTSWLGDGIAAEVTQDVFVTAWETLPSFRPDAPLRRWLFGIARHKCQQAFRNRARRRAIAHTFLDDIRRHVHTEPDHTPEHTMADEAQRTALQESLAQLQDVDRMLLVLRYWKELPMADIADIMGKTESAVRKQLERARQRLRQTMQTHAKE
jgi:RNA polymerase sigma-70 factor (ECF subfamily)